VNDYRELIEAYLAKLERGMLRRGGAAVNSVDELRDHLMQEAHAAERRGDDPAAAIAAAIERFGPAGTLARDFVRASDDAIQRMLAPIAIACGVAIAWIDTRPHWDDSGVTAGLLLLSGAVLGAFAARRVWLLALCIGVWLPLYYFATNHRFDTFFILGFPLAGAYVGHGMRRLFAPAR
jgi:hypothetical protein